MNWVIGCIFFFVAVISVLVSQIKSRAIVIGTARYSPQPILFILAVIAFMVSFIFFYRAYKNLHILKQGITTNAQIVSFMETGTFINNQPLFRFQLLVSLKGYAPYKATATRIMSFDDIHKIAPGDLIQIRVNRKNLDEIVIVG